MDEYNRLEGERFYIVSCSREVNGREQGDRALGYEVLKGCKLGDAERKFKEFVGIMKARKLIGRVRLEIGTRIREEGKDLNIPLYELASQYVGAGRKGSRMFLSVRDAEKGVENG